MLNYLIKKGLVKHGSVSAFVFNLHTDLPKVALLKHKKLRKWVVPGGHIESFENPFETIHREVKEETGLEIDVISFAHRDSSVPVTDVRQILPPEFIFEQLIPARPDEPEHVHIDHVYIALAKQTNLEPEDGVPDSIGWFTEKELDTLDMFDSNKIIAKKLFPLIMMSS
jgi:8-oxo-dGTP pyrophosphatase MutT (NUDIX family)